MMSFIEIRLKIKGEIKAKAVFAKGNKRAFKEEQRKNVSHKAFQPWIVAAEITALLNYYHEFRGSPYRHDVKDSVENYYYRKTYDQALTDLRKKYPVPEPQQEQTVA